MPKTRHSKIKTCDPFCPQSRKDAEVKSHQPEDLPYKEENDLKIPRKLKTMQYLLEHNGKPNIQSSEKRRKELAKITGQIKKTEAKKIRSDEFSIKRKLQKEDKELARLLKEKHRLEEMLK
ncbi:hypothetical protein KM1_195890 [Entamoeba histolytica HM-3:IMSS]|uniref:Uncharacterized protein n=4 Tax=Entamoeba histolytica TaxID=5759 RepID=C4M452_ENTH1|nr:hypothetical protein EHI_030390 [Entamoeba histolytica HM-1:IMSS]EAL44433.1 hypothetical protein EHI_030390 [Entamoeba histolytica HM-1:IMSS]EMS16351.1 hypothetical protein KM1_195890 [Entamoeba histolytica HM-3:IMSS]ENY61463.1 hypothetical protein EHI7A_110260 [Entamoeba histolytica HM-1:IMSS-A]GAT96129.1 hypothetical protein CL6EHI_030390 [Entamoeba histolytica]|eukprot:XP_649820.1 hypothetical protein EHI_030390 [Entamoeba histolytica HM-1:IMSS]